MEELYSLVMAIIKGIQNPILSAIGAIAVIFLSVFGKVLLDKARAEKAAREKEADKQRDLNDLEHNDTKAESKVSDRLNRRNGNETGTNSNQ